MVVHRRVVLFLAFSVSAWVQWGAVVRAQKEHPATCHERSTSDGRSQRNRTVAAAAPTICAAMNPGASAGRIPANVSVAERASVTAGFAKEVDAVNQ